MACKNRIKDGIDSTFDVPGLQDSEIIELFVIRFIDQLLYNCLFFGYFGLKFDWRKMLLVIYSTQPSQKFKFNVQPPPFDHCVLTLSHISL